MIKLSNQLVRARKMRGLTQMQLAERTGITYSSIKAYEEDRSIPGLYAMYLIAEVLKVSIDGIVNLGYGGVEFPGNLTERYAQNRNGKDSNE